MVLVQVWLVVTAALLGLLVVVMVVQYAWSLFVTARDRRVDTSRSGASKSARRPLTAGPLT